jgi:hypothetical protein
VVEQARALKLLSPDHFTVDGTLIEAWASLKSFRRKDAGPHEPPDDPGNPTVNLRGERRSNATHQSATDPEARLAKKGPGQEARLCYSANALMENRNGLLIELAVEPADGYAERNSARAVRTNGARAVREQYSQVQAAVLADAHHPGGLRWMCMYLLRHLKNRLSRTALP